MSSNRSFDRISDYYDLLYSDKDYGKEVAFIENIFKKTGSPKKILELGCGTGNYTQKLCERGYSVTGLDISENMLVRAKRKCVTCTFIQGDVRNFQLEEKFDACIAMFAVLGYVTQNSDILKTLKNIRAHLRPNGIFIFDVWNGLAVLRTLPEQRVKIMENDDVRVVRIANPKLRSFDQICEVNYKLIVLNKLTKTFNEFEENHIVRFYFPQEIKHLLAESGFEVLSICPFMHTDFTVDETVWNIAVLAKACEVNV